MLAVDFDVCRYGRASRRPLRKTARCPQACAKDRAEKNRRYLPDEHSYVPCEDYRRWQVDPECTTADFREFGRAEDHIMRTAAYRLIALREATVVGERDWLPDPRLVNPEVRARTTRDAMDILARLLTRFVCQARGAGWSWGELALLGQPPRPVSEPSWERRPVNPTRIRKGWMSNEFDRTLVRSTWA